jgi:hypothetical protein
MTLGNKRRQGVQHLIAYCLNDSCRHQALIDVKVSRRHSGAVVPVACEVWQVRGTRPAHRRATELEGSTRLN